MDWMPTGRRAALDRLAGIQRLESLVTGAGGLPHRRTVIPFEERRVHSMFVGPTISQVFKRDWEPVATAARAVAPHPPERRISHLRRIDPAQVWTDPDSEIRSWLAQPEAVRRLARVLSLPLALPDAEVRGSAATTVLRDAVGRSVVVGCWHGPSSHAQLAELLARAAGEELAGIIWVCGRFLPEQRKALDWLESVTDSSTPFHAVEMQLWAIDDSNVVPRLRVV